TGCERSHCAGCGSVKLFVCVQHSRHSKGTNPVLLSYLIVCGYHVSYDEGRTNETVDGVLDEPETKRTVTAFTDGFGCIFTCTGAGRRTGLLREDSTE